MEGIEGEYPVSERGRKSRSVDFPVRSIVRTPTCTQFAARLCERSFLRTGKSALRPPSLTGYEGDGMLGSFLHSFLRLGGLLC